MKLQPCLFASAIFLMAAGAAILFFPQELAYFLGSPRLLGGPLIVVKLLAAALFALGMLDWMNRFATVGGIYGRPVLMANFTFYFITTITLARVAFTTGASKAHWGGLAICAFFGTWFAWLLFGRSPGAKP